MSEIHTMITYKKNLKKHVGRMISMHKITYRASSHEYKFTSARMVGNKVRNIIDDTTITHPYWFSTFTIVFGYIVTGKLTSDGTKQKIVCSKIIWFLGIIVICWKSSVCPSTKIIISRQKKHRSSFSAHKKNETQVSEWEALSLNHSLIKLTSYIREDPLN